MRTDTFLAHHQSGHYRYRQALLTTRQAPVDFELIWVTAGDLAATIGGRPVHAGPGDLVLLEPGVPHTYWPGAGRGWEWFWLHVDGVGAGEIWTRLQGGVGPVRRLGQDPQIRARFVELVTSAATALDVPHAIRVDTCALSLLGLMIERLEAPTESRIASSRAGISALTTWILDHLDRSISLSDLVDASGWSAAQLTRMVRRELGLSPMQYVARLRMRRAERLLVDTELGVARIAQMVGFDDPLHFSRRFRQLTGRPPSQARVIAEPARPEIDSSTT